MSSMAEGFDASVKRACYSSDIRPVGQQRGQETPFSCYWFKGNPSPSPSPLDLQISSRWACFSKKIISKAKCVFLKVFSKF